MGKASLVTEYAHYANFQINSTYYAHKIGARLELITGTLSFDSPKYIGPGLKAVMMNSAKCLILRQTDLCDTVFQQ